MLKIDISTCEVPSSQTSCDMLNRVCLFSFYFYSKQSLCILNQSTLISERCQDQRTSRHLTSYMTYTTIYHPVLFMEEAVSKNKKLKKPVLQGRRFDSTYTRKVPYNWMQPRSSAKETTFSNFASRPLSISVGTGIFPR